MARNSLGSLVVSLGLDAAQYFAGLTKAEYQAQKSLANIRKSGESIKGIFSQSLGRELGALFSVTAVTLWTKSVLDAADALQDLHEETGSAVEDLSRLSNIAKIQGQSIDEFRSIFEKFAANLGGAGEESNKAAKALAALGVTARDPAQALVEVAKKLNEYADGARKASFAKALFSKEGVKFLPVLKAIAQDTGTAATRTAEQVKAADNLRESLRQLSVQSQTFADILLSDVVPAVNRLLEEFIEGRRIAGGFFEALNLFSSLPAVSNLKDVNEAIGGVERALDSAKQKAGAGLGGLLGGDQAVKNFEKQLAFLKSQRARMLRELGTDDPTNLDVRDILARRKPQLPELGGDDGKATRQRQERISDTQRYLEQLDRQEEQLRDLTVFEQALLDIQRNRIEGLKEGDTGRILKRAQEITLLKEQIQAEQDAKKAAEDMARAEEARNQQTADRILAFQREAEQTGESNRRLEEEIALIGKDEQARRALLTMFEKEAVQREINDIAARKAIATEEDEIKALQAQIDVRERRLQLLDQRELFTGLAEDAAGAKQFYDELGGSIAGAFEEAIVNGNNLRDIIKGLEQDLVRIITRKLVTKPLGNALSGFLKNLDPFGIGGGGSDIGMFAGAVPTYANGTNYARGGWSVVGERGPEMVNLPRGAQVIPNDVLQSRRAQRDQININMSFSPGTDSRTLGQAATMMEQSLRRHYARNG